MCVTPAVPLLAGLFAVVVLGLSLTARGNFPDSLTLTAEAGHEDWPEDGDEHEDELTVMRSELGDS